LAQKTVGRTSFRCEPSAIGERRYDVAIEITAPPYAKFGAVLTRREVLALIDCLREGFREGEPRSNED